LQSLVLTAKTYTNIPQNPENKVKNNWEGGWLGENRKYSQVRQNNNVRQGIADRRGASSANLVRKQL
jgi:hypothetical protein